MTEASAPALGRAQEIGASGDGARIGKELRRAMRVASGPAQPHIKIVRFHEIAERISQAVGERALMALERLMGLVLTAIAVEMLLRGIETFIRQI